MSFGHTAGVHLSCIEELFLRAVWHSTADWENSHGSELRNNLKKPVLPEGSLQWLHNLPRGREKCERQAGASSTPALSGQLPILALEQSGDRITRVLNSAKGHEANGMELSPGWEGWGGTRLLSGEEGRQVGVGEGLARLVFVLVV